VIWRGFIVSAHKNVGFSRENLAKLAALVLWTLLDAKDWGSFQWSGLVPRDKKERFLKAREAVYAKLPRLAQVLLCLNGHLPVMNLVRRYTPPFATLISPGDHILNNPGKFHLNEQLSKGSGNEVVLVMNGNAGIFIDSLTVVLARFRDVAMMGVTLEDLVDDKATNQDFAPVNQQGQAHFKAELGETERKACRRVTIRFAMNVQNATISITLFAIRGFVFLF
jgi:hypothetical protein